MNLTFRLQAAAVAALAAFACSTASAAEGHASLTDITFHLTDLRPDDGVTASYAFEPGSLTALAVGIAGPADAGINQHLSADEWMPELHVSNPQAGSSVAANVGSGAVSVDVHAWQVGQWADATAEQRVFASVPGGFAGINLAPHSALDITASYAYDLALQSGGCLGDPSTTRYCEQVQANVSFWLQDINGEQGGYHGQTLSMLNDPTLTSAHDSGSYSFHFVNDTDDWQTALLGASATATAGFMEVPPIPVPEPGSWVLMLAGLGVTGWLRQRRAARGL